MGKPNTSYHIQIKIKMPNAPQEPPASSKAQNQDFKDMEVLCTIKIQIEKQNSDHGYSKTSVNIQIKIKMPQPCQEHPVFFKAPNQDLKEMDVLCTFKIKIESQNADNGCIKAIALKYNDMKNSIIAIIGLVRQRQFLVPFCYLPITF